jgi:hypothetical protein
MAKNKTTVTDANVEEFINSFADSEQKKQDSFELLKIMQEVSGFEPKMYGPSIIGFGKYHYKYDSGHEGVAPLVGFSPRKAAISFYIYSGYMGDTQQDTILERFGKFKMGKGCIYVKKLSDINVDVLKELMRRNIEFLHTKYGKL